MRQTFDNCIEQKIFFTFFTLFLAFFSSLPRRSNYYSYRSNFIFDELALKIWAMNMHFNPIPIL